MRRKVGDKHPGLQRGPAGNDTADEANEDEDNDKEEEEERDEDYVNDTTVPPARNDTAAEDEPDDSLMTSQVSPEVEHGQAPAALTNAVVDVSTVPPAQAKTLGKIASSQVSEINRLSAILAGLNHSLTECYKIHTNWNHSHLV